MEEILYVFSFIFFFSLPFIFTLHWWPVAFLIFSPPLQNCHVVLPTKRCLLFCLSLTLNLCRPFSRWACGWPAAFFLFCLYLSLALFSKFVDMTIKLSLKLQTTRIQKQIPLSVFVFIESLVVSALEDSGGYAISRLKKPRVAFGLLLPVD